MYDVVLSCFLNLGRKEVVIRFLRNEVLSVFFFSLVNSYLRDS